MNLLGCYINFHFYSVVTVKLTWFFDPIIYKKCPHYLSQILLLKRFEYFHYGKYYDAFYLVDKVIKDLEYSHCKIRPDVYIFGEMSDIKERGSYLLGKQNNSKHLIPEYFEVIFSLKI